jgi:hypothetical protein
MALGLPFGCSRWYSVLTVTATASVVNVFVPPNGAFLDQASADAWGAANKTGAQTATSVQLQTAA